RPTVPSPDLRPDSSRTAPVVLPRKIKPDTACHQEPYPEKRCRRKTAEESSNSTHDALNPKEYASDRLKDRDNACSRLRKHPKDRNKPQDSTCKSRPPL